MFLQLVSFSSYYRLLGLCFISEAQFLSRGPGTVVIQKADGDTMGSCSGERLLPALA